MGERDPHHSCCFAAIVPAVLVMSRAALLVVIPATPAPPPAPPPHDGIHWRGRRNERPGHEGHRPRGGGRSDRKNPREQCHQGDERGDLAPRHLASIEHADESATSDEDDTRTNPRPLLKMPCRASCAVGLALALLLSSCNLPGLPTPSASASPGNTSRVAHLQLSEAEDAQTLDPALTNDPTSLAIGAELFQGLTRLDANLRPVPALAQSWEIADAGPVYTFHLRAAKYQSATPAQAHDALTSWKPALAPATTNPL